jgi:hypothetical protein
MHQGGAQRGGHEVAGHEATSHEDGRGPHDVGGLAAGPVDRAEHDAAFWEKRVDALLTLLYGSKKLMTVDQLRRGIEGLGAEAYDRLGYYERWIESITSTLLESGVLTADELGRRMAEVRARAAAEGAETASGGGAASGGAEEAR